MKKSKISTKGQVSNQTTGRTIVELYDYIERNLLPPNGYAFVHEYKTKKCINSRLMMFEVFTVNVFEKNGAAPRVFEVEFYRAIEWSCINLSSREITPVNREYQITGYENGRLFNMTVTTKQLNDADGDCGKSCELIYVMLENPHKEIIENMVIGNTRTIPVSRDGDYGTAIVYRSK